MLKHALRRIQRVSPLKSILYCSARTVHIDNPLDDEAYMNLALTLARQAFAADEIPVGAVLVSKRATASIALEISGYCVEKLPSVIGVGRNATVQNALLHAEMIAFEQGIRHLNTNRLDGSVLYVTMEPCIMCFGACLLHRIAEVVYAAPNEKYGALTAASLHHTKFNHTIKIRQGPGFHESRSLLQAYFRRRRLDGDRLRLNTQHPACGNVEGC